MEILLQSCVISRYYLASFKDLCSRKCRRFLYSGYWSVNLRALPIVLRILIGINSALVLFVFNLPLNEIARTQFFVRWMDCNTPLLEYVLSCVFRFLDCIFRFALVFILYYEFFIRLFCLGFGFVDSESTLVWTEGPIPEYCSVWTFWYSYLTDDSFKHHFPIFWILCEFLEFSWIKLKIFKTGVGQFRWPIPGFLIYKRLGISKSAFRQCFLKSCFLSKYFFWELSEFIENPANPV